jgi:hypothetical protein
MVECDDLAPDSTDLRTQPEERDALLDAASAALWQELETDTRPDADDREVLDINGEGPVERDDIQRTQMRVPLEHDVAVAPIDIRCAIDDQEQDSQVGGDQVVAGKNTDHKREGGDGEPPDTAEGRGDSADDNSLPRREQRHDTTLPKTEREALTAVNRATIEHDTTTDGTRVISLPDGNQSTYRVRNENGVRVADDWRIDVHDRQHDLGIGRRLAKATADDLIRGGVDRLNVTIGDEASLRTALTVFGDALKFEDDAEDSPRSPQAVLAAINHGRAADGEAFAGLRAQVDLQSFGVDHLEYHTSSDEVILDRCDFSKIQATEAGMHGEVDAMRQRILAMPEPHATNATLAFNELLANYKTHVLPVNEGERYEVRLSMVWDPDAGSTHLRLANYFFGEVSPGVPENINLHLSQFLEENVFFGESREEQGEAVDPVDLEVAEVLEEKGDETTAHLQQSGRGLQTIARVSTRALCVRFPEGGGGFVIDLKNVEVAREQTETDEDRGDEDVDDVISKFLEGYDEDET